MAEATPGTIETVLAGMADLAVPPVIVTGASSTDGPGPRVLHANAAYLGQTGCRRGEVIGKPPSILEGPAGERAARRRLCKALAEGRSTQVRLTLSRKDGSAVGVRLAVDPVADARGRITHWIWVHHAPTAARRSRPQSEARGGHTVKLEPDLATRLSVFLDQISIGLCTYDADDRLVLCNSKHRELYWASAPAMVPGARFEDLLRLAVSRGQYVDAVGREERWLAERIRAHRNPKGPLVHRLSSGRWVLVREHRLPDGGTVGIRTDITELKQKEQALTQRVAELETLQARLEEQGRRLAHLAENLAAARDEAERANRTKSEFLANMSHELRSPLNAIIGFAEIMKDELFGPLGLPEYTEYAYDIHASGVHLLELINDILDLSKIEAGRLGLNEQIVDVRAVVDEGLRFIQSDAEKGEVALRIRIADDLPSVYADERKLTQILLNLLSNAVKFTPSGGSVTVSARVNRQGELTVAVADKGIGIAPDDIPKALAAFGQVDSSLTRKYQGTGLGLPLTRALVELHDGRLDLHSSPGIGTTVTAYFPARRVIRESHIAAGA